MITTEIKKIRKLASFRMTPLLRIDFTNVVTFVYKDQVTKREEEYSYRDFETGLKGEIERLSQ